MSSNQDQGYAKLMQMASDKIAKLKAELDAVKSRDKSEPIAIIGMGCRFPGSASTPEAFWEVLQNGVDTITEVPPERWSINQYYDSDPTAPGKIYTRYGAFVEQIQNFDADFFGISPKEAINLDPQQRLLLEVTWEALEHSAINPQKLIETETGVFIGISSNDYFQKILRQGPEKIDAYSGVGNGHSIASGRISYILGLKGPSVAVDTACSSSLISTHLACSSLRNQECNLALAGGVHLLMSPDITVNYCKAKMLSADGRCKTFDAAADGFVRGEGCGIIVLKRLSDALSDRDNILAVIRGSASNQDGNSSGLTVPNGSSQKALIRQALENGGVAPDSVSYLEAHGTGTSLGDPIEVEAVGEVFEKTHSQQKPLIIGSVKTNIGHLESAAGIAGLMKVILQLQNRQIAPSLHFNQPNPYINWERLPVQVSTQLIPWSVNSQSRIAGVSSFALSGSNAHVVVEEAPIPVKEQEVKGKTEELWERPYHILTLSAKTEIALSELINRYQTYIETHSELELANICYTANSGRANFNHRLAIIASEKQDLIEKLHHPEADTENVVSGISRSSDVPAIAFLFTGQGSQYINMGKQLYQTESVFRETMEQCDRILRSELEYPLLDIIYPQTQQEVSDSALLNQTAYTQPALFALEYSLVQLWKSWGIKPDVVMGHSVGEYVAACVAGVFSLEEGLKLIAARGRLMQQLPNTGKMVAVKASELDVRQLIASYREEVAIAAINGPETVVISGSSTAIATIVKQLESKEIKTKELQVSHAFHSPLMEPMLVEFEAVAKQITYNKPKIPVISNVTGAKADKSIATASYWVNHVCQPVKFAQSMRTLQQQNYEVFLEIGPKPILLGMGVQCVPSEIGVWLPSLRSGMDECLQILSSLAQLSVGGINVDWAGFYQNSNFQKVILPTYPFQRKSYWIETSEVAQPRQISASESANTLISDLLQQGKIEDLTEHLKKSTNFDSKSWETIPEILDVLAKEHQQQLRINRVSQNLYKIKWELLSVLPQTNLKPGKWLILGNKENKLVVELSKYLQQQENEIYLVEPGNYYEKIVTGNYKINPSNPQDFEILLQDIQITTELNFDKVIHLWSLDTPNTENLEITDLEAAQVYGSGAVLHLVQALVKYCSSAQLWLLTRSTQFVSPQQKEVNVAASPLWGLGTVVSLEHPKFWGGLVDLDLQRSENEIEQLLTVINNSQQEDNLALRGKNIYAARLTKYFSPLSQPVSLKSDATYLITGGTGVLGLQTAKWMAHKGARRLVLISRSQPSAERQAAIAQLEEQGIQIIVLQADVCNREELSKVFAQIDTSESPLKGIVHAAGVAHAVGVGPIQPIEEIELTQLKDIMAAKVIGGWILHQLSQDKDLDFFVGFSSIAAVWGSFGQAHYSAGNHFLDSLVHYRQAKGLPSFSINWGPWSGGGVAGDKELEELRKKGVESISPEEGIAALEKLWTSGNVQTVVADINWNLFKQLYQIGRSRLLLKEIEIELPKTPESLPSNQEQKTEIWQKIVAAPESQQKDLLIDYVQKEVAKVLGRQEYELPSSELGFFEMGMDSLMAVELRNNLSHQLGVNLPSTLTFDFPNIEQLSSYLATEVLALERVNATSKEQNVKVSDLNEPIAIIGMSCRFPGEARDLDSFWELLKSGTNTRQEIPQERWNIESFYSPDREAQGKMYTRYGNFLQDVQHFDATFFGIAPREAVALDPQQRLLLEVTWEALEGAAQVPQRLAEESVGVFIGNDGQDYAELVTKHLEEEPNSPIATYGGIGNAFSATAGRLSYTLGLSGPAIAIDTACSSSLVAIHQACNSLRLGECKMAIAGGVKLHLSPTSYLFASNARMISADGLCKTFDATADGFSRGEGCGIVVLKPLSDAERDGNRVLAIIRGSAVNQDGPSSGFTVPNGQAQQRLIREALEQAQINPQDISYLEAHGTGTSLGDPIELNAAANVLCEERSSESPLLVGSVKTNIGHLEGAAGVSGLIKVVLALQHQQIPPHLNLQEPNPKFNWEYWPIQVPRELVPWEVAGKRCAGVSSFGFTGINAHVVLEEAPTEVNSPQGAYSPSEVDSTEFTPREATGNSEEQQECSEHLLTLSAKTEKALYELVERYNNYLESHQELELANVCYSANTGRAHFEHRLAVLAANQQELEVKLNNFTSGDEVAGIFTGQMSSITSKPKIAFLFTGQGSQYLNMGRELYEHSSVFQNAINECDRILSPLLDKSIIELLYSDLEDKDGISLLDETAYTQPALFSVEYALTQLWKSWGIEPDIVLGHSVGEYVAACIAGIFSLEDGLRLIANRGHLMQELPSGGEMVVVMASEEQVREAIAPYLEQVDLAAINGPNNVVISGMSQAIASICNNFNKLGIKTKSLQVSHAFHSPLMEPILVNFATVAQEINYYPPNIPIISNVTGTLSSGNMATADYWVNHVRQPVQFSKSMETLKEEGYKVFLEIGPKPILLGMGQYCLPGSSGSWLPSLRPAVEEWQQILSSLAQLYVQGVKVDWLGFDGDYPRQHISLPTYPFQRERYWIETSKPRVPLNTLITNNQEDIPTLTQKLEKLGNLSPSEVEMLPKLLELLTKNYEQEFQTNSIQDYLYELQWKVKPRFSELLPPDYLPSLEELYEELNSTSRDLFAQNNLENYQEISNHLEELSVEYIVQSLQEMDWQYQPGEKFKIDIVREEFGIAASHNRLFNRILQILAEVDILQKHQDHWEVLKPLPKVSPNLKHQTLLNQYPTAIAELTMLQRCATQLTGVLRKQIDPIQLVFPKGDLNAATQIYQNSPAAKVMNDLIQNVVLRILENLPSNQGIRFLEVGAGTGGTTSSILPHLNSSQIEYVFTDIGALFTTKAQEKFQDYPFISYQTLNIELDPETQGFKSNHYDVIIAANVLHATSLLKQTLSHVRKLLAPGGILILLEATVPIKWADLIFGLLEGWSKFQDLELRPDYPLLNRLKWKQVLKESGFSQVVALPEFNNMPLALSQQAVIVAQADGTTTAPTPSISPKWLIFADKKGFAQHIVTKLNAMGQESTLVFYGEEYKQIEPAEVTINPENPQDLDRLLAIQAVDSSNKINILHLWSLDICEADRLTPENFPESLQIGCGAILHLVQALLKAELTQQSQLWIVTQDSQPVIANSVMSGLAQSSMWGMSQAISWEHPELWGGIIDLDSSSSIDELVTKLISEVYDSDGEDRIAFRDKLRYVERLVGEISQVPPEVGSIDFDGTYIIAGGVGAFAVATAKWMIQKGCQSLILITPTQPSQEQMTEISYLQQQAKVIVIQADISHFEEISKVFADTDSNLPKLKGIIHIPDIEKFTPMQQMEITELENVMATNIIGVWNLHQLSLDRKLDFFVSFSSIASVLGSAGLGHYGASNHFLDSLAHYRRAQGLSGLSINWGPILDGGIVTETELKEFRKRGVNTLSLNQKVVILEQLFIWGNIQTVVADIDWSLFKQLYQIGRPRLLLEEILVKDQESQPSNDDLQSKILQQMDMVSESERMELLIGHIQQEVMKVLGFKESQRPTPEEGFFAMGMDSLTAIEFKNSLEASFQGSLPTTLVFEFPNILSLAKYVARKILNWEMFEREEITIDKKDEDIAGENQKISMDIKQLSEQEVEKLINQELEELGIED